MKRLATLACVILFATAAVAGPGGGPGSGPGGKQGMGGHRMGGAGMGGSMEGNLFPPEFVLMNQVALGLSNEQVAAIKKQVGDTQGRLLDAKVDLSRVTEQLRAALEGAKVDEAAALNLAAQAMDLEKQVKTAHLGLMIRVKNTLTEEQQDKARALRPQRRAGQSDEATE
jgi:Spy/CpxP family protein refolding chaperone